MTEAQARLPLLLLAHVTLPLHPRLLPEQHPALQLVLQVVLQQVQLQLAALRMSLILSVRPMGTTMMTRMRKTTRTAAPALPLVLLRVLLVLVLVLPRHSMRGIAPTLLLSTLLVSAHALAVQASRLRVP